MISKNNNPQNSPTSSNVFLPHLPPEVGNYRSEAMSEALLANLRCDLEEALERFSKGDSSSAKIFEVKGHESRPASFFLAQGRKQFHLRVEGARLNVMLTKRHEFDVKQELFLDLEPCFDGSSQHLWRKADSHFLTSEMLVALLFKELGT